MFDLCPVAFIRQVAFGNLLRKNRILCLFNPARHAKYEG